MRDTVNVMLTFTAIRNEYLNSKQGRAEFADEEE